MSISLYKTFFYGFLLIIRLEFYHVVLFDDFAISTAYRYQVRIADNCRLFGRFHFSNVGEK